MLGQKMKENMQMIKAMLVISVLVVILGCATVRQQDLDAWVGVPVEALDTHSIFLTIPMYRTVTDSGIEIRNYVNGRDVANCFRSVGVSSTGNYVNANAFTTCSSGRIVCNNIFYIKDGKVLEYAPTGRCFTDERAKPQARYLRMRNQ